jgi:Mrp family chromosome partitioning ATPase
MPPNPADLLSLAGLDQLITRLENAYDIVLIDTPPVRAVSDPILIGRHTDGMILIARVDVTKRETFHQAAEALHQSGIHLLGVVLNQARDAEGAGYYYYYQSEKPSGDEK